MGDETTARWRGLHCDEKLLTCPPPASSNFHKLCFEHLDRTAEPTRLIQKTARRQPPQNITPSDIVPIYVTR